MGVSILRDDEGGRVAMKPKERRQPFREVTHKYERCEKSVRRPDPGQDGEALHHAGGHVWVKGRAEEGP